MSQAQIDAYDASVASIDAEIALIDAETIGPTGVQEYVTDRRNNLVSKKNVYIFRRDLIQTVLDNPITAGEQTTIDGINTLFSNQYADHLANIVTYDLTERNNFFTLYGQAETDVVRECIIKNFFNIN